MSEDIVDRLRDNTELEFDYTINLQEEAAVEIERLREALAFADQHSVKIEQLFVELMEQHSKLIQDMKKL